MMEKRLSSPSNSKRAILLMGLAAALFISCAPTASQQNGNGYGVGSSSGKKTEQRKSPRQETGDNSEPVETRLTRLFDICKSDKVEDAASYFVYRGPDKDREWKDTLRADDPAEKAAIVEICRRIKGYLDESSGYSFDGVQVKRESEGEWHALLVSFQQGEKTKKVIFAFLQIRGQFAIGDIDNE